MHRTPLLCVTHLVFVCDAEWSAELGYIYIWSLRLAHGEKWRGRVPHEDGNISADSSGGAGGLFMCHFCKVCIANVLV